MFVVYGFKMQNYSPVLNTSVNTASDYTSFHLISYSYFILRSAFKLFLCQKPFDSTECQLCFHEKTLYKEPPKNRAFVKSILHAESLSHYKMTPLSGEFKDQWDEECLK